ncbi:hypothetical protein P4S64_15215 [Vibrio sp. M60_M31a]
MAIVHFWSSAMNNYFVYHNEDKIGKSVKEIGLLAAYTNNDVEGSEGGVAWVISAVGKRNKKYKVSMCFEITKAHDGIQPLRRSIYSKTQLLAKLELC